MKVNKLAAQDAYNWARAEMFFGEGAGTRRKLIGAEIQQKMQDIPGYEAAFERAYKAQDFAEHAIRAAKERKKIDRVAGISKNTRALVRGDSRGLSTSVVIAAAVVYYAHQTGYDKVVIAKAKKQYRKSKAWADYKYKAYKAQNTTHIHKQERM